MDAPVEKITVNVMDLDKETAFYTKEIYYGKDQFDLIIKPCADFVSKDGYHSPFEILRIYP